MNTPQKNFFQRHRTFLVALGIIALLGGIALAYFTGDADPWGTIGGAITALGLILIIFVVATPKD